MTDNLKILSIVPYRVLPAKLGGEKGIALFNEYLGKKIDLIAVTTQNNDPQYAKNYRVLNVLSNSRWRYANFFLYFRFRKLIRQQHISHLIIEHPYYGWLAWLLRKTAPVTWVVHSHNIEYMRSRSIGRWWWKALKWYETWVYKKSDINFFISEDDKTHAVNELGIDLKKSHAITYGIEQSNLPEDREEARAWIQHKHAIPADTSILLFNGALYHHTNYDALSLILEKINPVLMADKQFNYRIIVCGLGLPEQFNDLNAYAEKNIIYAGFVDDISIYFKAADIFLNPILSGGGVKTKAIEAIGYNCTVISSELGALGLLREVCKHKLVVVPGNDPVTFAGEVIRHSALDENTPPEFFGYYSWEGISDKVKTILTQHA